MQKNSESYIQLADGSGIVLAILEPSECERVYCIDTSGNKLSLWEQGNRYKRKKQRTLWCQIRIRNINMNS